MASFCFYSIYKKTKCKLQNTWKIQKNYEEENKNPYHPQLIIWFLSVFCPPVHLSKAVTMLYMWYTVLNISFHCDFMMNIPQVIRVILKLIFKFLKYFIASSFGRTFYLFRVIFEQYFWLIYRNFKQADTEKYSEEKGQTLMSVSHTLWNVGFCLILSAGDRRYKSSFSNIKYLISWHVP